MTVQVVSMTQIEISRNYI